MQTFAHNCQLLHRWLKFWVNKQLISLLFIQIWTICAWPVCMTVGFPWGTPERAQCGVHAACLRMVGDGERHCEEHLPHLAAGCALFQPYPHPCYCRDSLFTAARRGRNTVYTYVSGQAFFPFPHMPECYCRLTQGGTVKVISFQRFALAPSPFSCRSFPSPFYPHPYSFILSLGFIIRFLWHPKQS